MNEQGIGASVRRKEDLRFLTGKGRYTDDIVRPNQTYAYFLRSPYAHAQIAGIDSNEARSSPGVLAIFTGVDTAADNLGGLPCGWQIHNKDGSPMKEPPHPLLASDKVRHVGDPVAVVIAETLNQAKDAVERIDVDYQELPAVVSTSKAVEAGTPLVHDEVPDNLCFDWELGDKGAVEAAFANAEHVTAIDLTNNRLIPNAMEPRSYIGEYDSSTEQYTLYTTSQNPHLIRLLMGAFVLNIPEHRLRVIAPDVGGGFGSKIYHYAEEAIVTWAAKKIGRPVKWTAERGEAFMSDAHGRDHVTQAHLALASDGRFLGLRVSTLANMGAYLSSFATCIPTYLSATLLAGPYKTPAIYAEVKAIFTNTVPVDAYRGAGRPEAVYLLERLVDKAAREMNIDPVAIRRRNFIQPEDFPYQTPVALEYDSGDYEATLDDALKHADWDGFPTRHASAAARGKLRGIGISTYLEACGLAPSNIAGALGARAGLYEAAQVRVEPTGSVTVYTGSHSHGQGHETTFAQIVSDQLGIPYDDVTIVHGDTEKVPFGMGTYGSRSLAVGGEAIAKAVDKVIHKGKKIAAHLLEVSDSDVVFEDGSFAVAGTDKAKTFAEVALSAYVPHQYPLETLEPGLIESAYYDPKNFTFPGGCHICEVEIDPETGVTQVVNFTAVDDVGRVINPMIVAGQVHGGVAQGIGQAGGAAGRGAGSGRGTRAEHLRGGRCADRGRQHRGTDTGADDGHHSGNQQGPFRAGADTRGRTAVAGVAGECEHHPTAGTTAVRMTDPPILQVLNLQQQLGEFVLRIGRLDIQQGEVLGLLGPTGAGKSTLLQILAGLAAADAGGVLSGGQPLLNRDLSTRRRFTLVHQTALLLTGTVRFNVEYGLRLRGESKPARRVDSILEQLGLMTLAEQSSDTLSGGQVQLVALARALVIEPDVLLLDEPTAHLDPAHVALVEETIHQIREERRVTVVWATHNLFQARRVAGRAALLLNGKLVEEAPTERLFTSPSDPRTADFVNGRMVY